MLIQHGIASSGVAVDMAPIAHVVLQFCESMETLRLISAKTNFTSENEKLVNILLKDLTTAGYRLTDGVCTVADYPYYQANEIRTKRQIVTSIMLLLTTVGTFFSFIVPSIHQQIKPYQLTTIQVISKPWTSIHQTLTTSCNIS